MSRFCFAFYGFFMARWRIWEHTDVFARQDGAENVGHVFVAHLMRLRRFLQLLKHLLARATMRRIHFKHLQQKYNHQLTLTVKQSKCSEHTLYPSCSASAYTRAVFPTPCGPDRSMVLESCRVRSSSSHSLSSDSPLESRSKSLLSEKRDFSTTSSEANSNAI